MSRQTIHNSTAGLLLVLLLSGCGKAPVAVDEIRSVRSIVASPGSVNVLNTYAGEVRPRYESSLGFRVAGKIERRLVNVGDRVEKGALLLQLDASDLALNEASSRATVAAQAAQFAVEQADLERYRKLLEQGFISAAQFDRQKTTFEAAEAQLASVKAQARVSDNQTGYAQLRADSEGTITAINAEAGQVVASGQAVVRLAQSGTKEIAVNIPEHQVEHLKTGQPVQVSLWAARELKLSGRIRELSSSADPATRTYALRVSIDDAPEAMKLGMSASVAIPGSKQPALIRLPLAAYIEQKGVHGVWVFDEQAGIVNFRPVRLAGFDGNEALIGEGLKPGERVVTAGAPLLKPGQKVRLMADTAAAN